MRHLTITTAVLVAAALGVAGCGSSSSTGSATTAAAKPVTVTAPWTRVTAPQEKNGAAYMTISSTDGDTLTAVSVPASVAGEAQLHETTTSGGSMSGGMKGMKEVSSITIPAGGSVTLKPGGYHVMLMDLAKPIAAGATVPLTLTFQKAGTVKVDAPARSS